MNTRLSKLVALVVGLGVVATVLIGLAATALAGRLIPHGQGIAGGPGGQFFSEMGAFNQLPCGTRPKHILIRSGHKIDSIGLTHVRLDGSGFWTGTYGGRGGVQRQIDLADGEDIIAMEGTFGEHVHQIRFITNRGVTPMFGETVGPHPFHFTAQPGCRIVGFHGRAGALVDAIGPLLDCL